MIKKNILYILMGVVFSFVNQEKVQATDLDHEKDLPKTTVGASFITPLGPGEIALIQGYKAAGLSINLHSVRGLMSWTQKALGGVGRFAAEARRQFHMDPDYAKGLYQDYKPIYEALRECYIRDDDQGEKVFIEQVVSEGKMTADYAKQFYSRFKPGQTLLEYWLQQKQEEVAQTSPVITQPSASPLISTPTLDTTASSSSSSQPIHEEKEQENLDSSSATWTSAPPKPSTGLRHRNVSPSSAASGAVFPTP